MNDEMMGNELLYRAQEDNSFFQDELAKLTPAELKERFSSLLAFGTGGMRGRIGCGTNHINSYMVRRLSMAIAHYLANINQPSIAIAYDSRYFSREFALQAALVFAAHHIKVYLFSALRGVPLLSFAVRQLRTSMGVMITASHNPPDYNGYKLYNADGSQITEPTDQHIILLMHQVVEIKSVTEKEAIEAGFLCYLDDQIDQDYQAMLAPYLSRHDLVKKRTDDFTIVYSALHGTGGQNIPLILSHYGFNVISVEEQQRPDGGFHTIKSPNPEDKDAFAMALSLAKRVGAQMVLVTDPDADRIGVATLHQGNHYVILNGNQMGSLMLDYRSATLLGNGDLPNNSYFINTVVSSPLQCAIAKFYGLEYFSVLTGFKNIAQKIAQQEKLSKNFIFACEESYGMLITPFIRDKDAISAALLLAECGLFYYSEGHSLMDQVDNISKRFGYFVEDQQNYSLGGIKGQEIITRLMADLRQLNPSMLNNHLRIKKDYLTDYDHLTPTNLLEFSHEDGSKIMVRPSGTEPKIKFYIMAFDRENEEKAIKKIELLKESITHLMDRYLVN